MGIDDIQGGGRSMSVVPSGRLVEPFSSYVVPAGEFSVVGYLLRIPSHGGHWITVLPGRSLHFNPAHPYSDHRQDTPAALLCDSLYPCPHVITLEDTEKLLVTCAMDLASLRPQEYQGSWACFLVGYEIDGLSD